MSKTHMAININGDFVWIPACNKTLDDLWNWKIVARFKSVTCKRCIRAVEKYNRDNPKDKIK